MLLPFGRKMFFVAAPAQFAGLRAFTDESVHRPGVDELAGALARQGVLGIAFGAVDGFHAQFHRQRRPLRLRLRDPGAAEDVFRQIDQRLFHPV